MECGDVTPLLFLFWHGSGRKRNRGKTRTRNKSGGTSPHSIKRNSKTSKRGEVMAAPTMADWTGQQVANGRYIVGRKLAEGGMAIIYLAQDRNLGNIVVIKAPRAEMLSDKDFTARFTREICSLAELSHPHILKV